MDAEAGRRARGEPWPWPRSRCAWDGVMRMSICQCVLVRARAVRAVPCLCVARGRALAFVRRGETRTRVVQSGDAPPPACATAELRITVMRVCAQPARAPDSRGHACVRTTGSRTGLARPSDALRLTPRPHPGRVNSDVESPAPGARGSWAFDIVRVSVECRVRTRGAGARKGRETEKGDTNKPQTCHATRLVSRAAAGVRAAGGRSSRPVVRTSAF